MSLETNESIEYFREGLKKAASRLRELGALEKNKSWAGIADQIDMLRKSGEMLYKQKAIKRAELLKQVGGVPN